MEKPAVEIQPIFPYEHWHNHSSCIVEMPGGTGELRACWYRGSGERKSDDVHICGATYLPGKGWKMLPTLADTPGFPDTNPFMMIDRLDRWWVFYGTQLDNNWESTLLKYRRTASGSTSLVENGLIHLKPDDEGFVDAVDHLLPEAFINTVAENAEEKAKLPIYLEKQKERARNKLSRRIGWMGRCHPLVEGSRIYLPLYSDGFDFSLIAISHDNGETWRCSLPLIGAGAVQPSLFRRKDGTLLAYCRNNGPAPKRILASESHDDGTSWSVACPVELPNFGSSVAGVVLKDGRWLLCYNDTGPERASLVISISHDEGHTWQPSQTIERATEKHKGSSHYPSVIQTRNGDVHITYTSTRGSDDIPNDPDGRPERETIKHARLPLGWLN